MDAQGREAANESGVTGQVAQRATQVREQVKEKVADLGRKATDKIDEQRERAASTLDSTASAIHERGERLTSTTSNAIHTTAEKIQSASDYLREHDAQMMMDDFQRLVRRYPGQALAAAAVIGFLAGRALRSGD